MMLGLKLKKLLARDLSFGEAQRVAVARGIINKPLKLYLLMNQPHH